MTDAQAQMIATAPEELADVMRAWLDATQRLQATHETLQREIERLRSELLSKDRELERRRRLACLGELAAGVAHEVRNPLGAIRLYTGLLRAECGRRPAAQELLDKIEGGIRAIDGVVQDTLALAPRRGIHGSCALEAVVQGAVDLARRSLELRGCTLRRRGQAGAIHVRGDLPGLQRVLLNLVSNAAEASPRGGVVELEVSADAGAAAADAAGGEQAGGERAGGLATIRVLDRGTGLPDEVLERIFDPFFTTKESGTGLGLTIAHRVADAYGGRLSAGNRPGGGAAFELALPMVNVRNDASDWSARQTTAA